MSISHNILRSVRLSLWLFAIISVCFVVNRSHTANAASPNLINFQGKVVNADGTNVTDGSYSFDFVLYDDVSLGTPSDGVRDKWHELSKTVTVTNGIFQTNLGSATSLPNFNTNNSLYLAVKFNGDAAGYMTPRVQITSVPYALNADNVGGVAATSLARVDASNTFANSNIFSGLSTYNTDADFVFNGTENLSITSDLAGTLNLLSIIATPSSTAGTAQGLFIQQANSANSNGLDGAVVIDNADTDLALTYGILVTSTGFNNGVVDAIDVSATSIQNGINLGSNNLILSGDTINDFTGNGLTVSSSALTISVAASADGLSSTTSTGSGLEVLASGLALIQGCANTEILKWNETTDVWACGADATGGGGSTTFQQAYDADTDGSNVTVTLSSTDGSLIFDNPSSSGTGSAFTMQVSQSNTTAAASILDLIQSSNAANGVNLTANSIDGETAFAITSNALTSGRGLTISSSSTAFTGSLAELTLSGSNAANTGSVFKISNTGVASANTGLFIDHRATGSGNLAFRIDDSASDTTPFIVDGNGNVGIGTTSAGAGLQVGSTSNHQDSWFYGDVTKKALISKFALTNVSDIFVYDTTRDADQGKWTDTRTSRSLSWYNETKDNTGGACVVSSDDRCGGSRFPAKAIIIATPDAVYIFDADGNTMWMKFSQAGTYTFGADTNNNPSSVYAFSGVLYVGTNGASSTGMYSIDFTQDRMYRYNTTDRNQGDKDISNRNSTVTYNVSSNTNFKFIGAGSVQVNDVSAASVYGGSSVLTNGGPLSGATFICAATDDGMQVISLTTQKTTPYGPAITDQYSACSVTRRGRLYGLNVTKQQLDRYGAAATSNSNIDTDQVASSTGITTAYKSWDESVTTSAGPNLFKTAQTVNVKPDTLEVIERGSAADEKGDLIYVGHGGGLTEIHDQDASATITTLGWSKFYSTTRETPLMNGNARGMFLLDDAAGSTTVADQSVRASVLAVKGTVTLGGDGVHNTSALFDNSTGYLCSDANADATCDTDADFNVGLISSSITGWFKHSATAPASGTDVLVDRRFTAFAGTEGVGYTVEMNTTGNIIYGIQDTAATSAYDDSVTSTIGFNDNQWHHFAAVNTDTALCLYIDGKLAVACDASLAATLTLDASQITTIGADASGASGANFWDGSIDDIYFAGNGSTTSDSLSQTQVRKMYLEGRAALSRPSASFVDATTATSTTIGDSTASWVPNSFVGSIVEITGGTGAGQTRRITSNSATVFTVSPAFTSAPDTTSDFEVKPEQLYGATDTVYGIGLTDNAFLGDNRKLYVGTNDGSDGGGITLFEGQGNSYVTDVFHSGTAVTDDNSGTWSGTDYDDIQAIGTNGTSVVPGSLAHFWTETDELDFQVTLDALANRLNSVRGELLVDGITGTSLEVGANGGADLAERYTSSEPLEAGMVVSLEANNVGAVKKSTAPYEKEVLGIVSTAPGATLGPVADNSYPIALVGRVPVRVTNENGPIKSGDRVAASLTAGYAMKATQAGRVLGTALDDFTEAKQLSCPEGTPSTVTCGEVTVFVNLVDYTGDDVDHVLSSADFSLIGADSVLDPIDGLIDLQTDFTAEQAEAKRAEMKKVDNILRYLASRRSKVGSSGSSILTDKVSSVAINTADLFAQNIFASTITVDRIKANKVEGLEVLTDKISSLQAQQNANRVAQGQTPTNTTLTSSTPIDLSNLVIKTGSSSLDFTVGRYLYADGGLRVNGAAEFAADVEFLKLVSFLDKVNFQNDVSLLGKITFGNDQAGFAVMKHGKQSLDVRYTTPYDDPPVVTLNIRNGQFANYSYKYIKDDEQKKVLGFTILLQQSVINDVEFSWSTIAVKDAKTTVPAED